MQQSPHDNNQSDALGATPLYSTNDVVIRVGLHLGIKGKAAVDRINSESVEMA